MHATHNITKRIILAVAAAILSDDFDDDSGSEECSNGTVAKAKSGAIGSAKCLPKQATAVLKAWLFQHIWVGICIQ